MAHIVRNITFRILFPGPPAEAAKADEEFAPESPPSYQMSAVPTLPSTPIPPPPPHPSRPRRFPWQNFFYNSLALTVSGIALGIIILLVWAFDNKPAPTFDTNIISSWYEAITLNSVLSWLAVISKITLMIPVAECIGQMRWVLFGSARRKLSDLDLIDGASRDVFGAVGWILRFRGGYVSLCRSLWRLSLTFPGFWSTLVPH